jgi:putative oxidoreductase
MRKTLITFFSPGGLWQNSGIAMIRVILGVFMAYHGWEVFTAGKMNEYAKWLTDIKFPAPTFMAYLGKGIELVSGVLITVGLFTRLAIIPLAVTMAVISFGIGKGRIFMEDQHPFLFILLAFVFFFTGPGKWSLDYLLFERKAFSKKRL